MSAIIVMPPPPPSCPSCGRREQRIDVCAHCGHRYDAFPGCLVVSLAVAMFGLLVITALWLGLIGLRWFGGEGPLFHLIARDVRDLLSLRLW